MITMLDRCLKFLKSGTYRRLVSEGYFVVSDQAAATIDFRRRDVWKFLDGVAAADDELRDEGAARRLVYNICEIFGDVAAADGLQIRKRSAQLRVYFDGQYAGQKDTKEIQLLKGSCREFEAECV